jgi:hypothetical protein
MQIQPYGPIRIKSQQLTPSPIGRRTQQVSLLLCIEADECAVS